MKSSARNIRLASYDDLFSSGAKEGEEKVQEVALADIFPFRGHSFRVLDDEAMQDMVESIKAHGILVPGIVRPRAEGGYEMVAGHRRKYALELAGIAVMPVIVRELDDDCAVLMMVDSNLQRENLLPSEKARAYRMKMEALRHQGMKGTSCQVGGKWSVDVLSENSNDSPRNIYRFIRLTELIPGLLQMADDKKLSFNSAVELSYLLKEEQEKLLEVMGKVDVVPSLGQAERLKKYSRDGKLDGGVMDAVLTEGHPEPVRVTLKGNRLRQYFPQSYTRKQMEDVIFTLLESWKTENV